MIALIGPVFAASLIGSPHCAAMCGPFVAFYSGQPGRQAWLPHLAYNAGRLLSYVALGAVAGALGAGADRIGALAGIGRGAAILAGLAMVAWGLATIAQHLGARLPRAPVATIGAGPLAVALRAVQRQPPALRALVIGVLSTMLPCGFLYVFVATAGGTGSAAHGALAMAVFWSGTLPLMAGLGVAARGTLGPLARRLPLVTAVALIVMGALTLTGRMLPHAHGTHAHPAGAPATHGHP